MHEYKNYNGCCVVCGVEILGKKIFCEICKSKRIKEKYKRTSGKCITCGVDVTGSKKFCKVCIIKRKEQQKPKDYYKEYCKTHKKQRTDKEKGQIILWQKKNKEKVKASSLLQYAIKTGRITKETKCSICKREDTRIIGHHSDYTKPYEVIWLCNSCHKKIHHNIRKNKDRQTENKGVE